MSQDLFAESARLGVLLGALEIPWEGLAGVVAAFPEEVPRYTEFSVSDSDAALGVMVKGEGQDFTHRVAHFMERNSVPQERLKRLLATAKHFEHINLFFKVEADRSGILEMSWYFRRRPSVDVALDFLKADGIDDAAFVRDIAQRLGKGTVHFVGGSEGRSGSGNKLYFSQPDSPGAWARLRAVAAHTGVGAEWGRLEANAGGLQGLFSFLSIGWADGVRVPGFKLDVHGLTGLTLGRIVRGAPNEALQRIHLLLSLHDKEQVDYAGFRLSPGQPLTTKVYAAR